jgi:hypothetical protein
MKISFRYILRKLTAWLFILAVSYLAASFVSKHLNPNFWDFDSRLTFAFFVMWISVFFKRRF